MLSHLAPRPPPLGVRPHVASSPTTRAPLMFIFNVARQTVILADRLFQVPYRTLSSYLTSCVHFHFRFHCHSHFSRGLEFQLIIPFSAGLCYAPHWSAVIGTFLLRSLSFSSRLIFGLSAINLARTFICTANFIFIIGWVSFSFSFSFWLTFSFRIGCVQ